MEEKIQLAVSNSHLVAQTLGCDEPIVRFKGLFISMAKLGSQPDYPAVKEFLDELDDIEIWDYERFKEKLRQAGTSEDYIRLLERSVMTWHVGSAR